MSPADVDAVRKLAGGIQVRGKACPRPITAFSQCGLPDAITDWLKRRKYEQPFAIQMQAIPCLMAGRDVIGIAQTGSGKTLAYLLPAVRHAAAQPPLRPNEGPIVLVLCPTRELAVQVSREARRVFALAGLAAAAVYGGAPLGPQLSALRRGAEAVVATPGRLIDVLTLNGGRATNLRRVSFVVCDEADRMLDMGFEPQLAMILGAIRPDRQAALFSATFPAHIEALARRLLRKPVEIVVGEKSRPCAAVEQLVEVHADHRSKLRRLLQLLGEWAEHGSVLVFVTTQAQADGLFAELLRLGYFAAVLHGGQDQEDRDGTIREFKEGAVTLLIATSVAARGLDVKSIVLVVNFYAPDHLEDYIHRIGRTGRAGNVGVAYTFILPSEADRAEDLVRALREAGSDPPQALLDLDEQFRTRCSLGLEKRRSGKAKGFRGRGFKFDEVSQQEAERARARQALGLEDDVEEGGDAAAAGEAGGGAAGGGAAGAAGAAGVATVGASGGGAAGFGAAAGGFGGGFGGATASAASGAGVHSTAGGNGAVATAAAAVAAAAAAAKAAAAGAAGGAPGPASVAPAAAGGASLGLMPAAVPSGLGGILAGLAPAPPSSSGQLVASVRAQLLARIGRGDGAAAEAAAAAAAGALAVCSSAGPAASGPAAGGSAAASLQLALRSTDLRDKQHLMHAIAVANATPSSATPSWAPAAVPGSVPGLGPAAFVDPATGNTVDEFCINEYPQEARFRVTHRETLARLGEAAGCVLQVKGRFVPPEEQNLNVKRLYVEIIGPTKVAVQRCRHEIKAVAEAAALRSLNSAAANFIGKLPGRYSVV